MKKIYYLIAALVIILALGFIANAQGGKFFYSLGDLVVRAYSTPQEFLADGGRWEDVRPLITDQLGGVEVTGEYNSTTTIQGSVNVDTLIQTGPGTLGSVIITVGGDMRFNLLNATTTDATKRATSQATSTITLAQFPASATVGTYVFDTIFTRGLFFDVVSGTLGTTTITWRN